MVDASDNEKTANETAWGTAIGTGTVAKDNGQLVTGGTVYNSMLTKANIDMDNISSNGKNVIRNLAKDAVKVVDGSHTYVTSKEDGNATAYSVNIKTGQVASGVSDLVTGGTVYDAIQNAKISGTGGANVDLTGKAEVGAGNVGANLSKFSADNLTDEQKLAEKRDNENDWGAALGTGAIANSDGSDADTNGSKQLVKGNTVYKEVRPTSDGTYVKTAQTTAQNLTALDKQAARSVLYDLAADQTVDKTKITLEGGTDGTTITNVKAGTADTDAVNFKQLKDKISDVTYTAGKGIDLSNKVISAKAGKGITLNDDGINVNLGNHLATDTNGAIHVLDNGVVEASNTDLVTGGTVYSALQKQKTDLTNNLSVNAGWGINIKDDTTTDENGKETTTKNVISLNRNLGTNYTDKKHKGNEKVTVATSATGLVLGGYAEDNGSESDPEVTYGATGDDSVTVGGKDALASGKGSVVTGGLDNVASGANATVVGGDYNDASGKQSIVLGGRDNNASGNNATVSGGYFNVASGDHAATLGGFSNYALGTGSVSIGGYGKNYTTGYDSSVNGIYSVGIAGGSTGDKADYSLAAGNQSVVTVANGTAIGYQATANKAGTIAFGHDAGDVSGYTVEWEKLPDGQYNADGTNYDYTKAPKSITGTTTYKDSAYNRLVKVADGVEDHDVVVMEQLKQYAEKNAGNIGNNIKVYKTDKNGNIQLGDDKKPSVDETATTKAKNDSKDAWGKALGAKTEDMSTSTAASNSDQLITGKTLYNYDKPTTNGTYVNQNQTTGQNLSALDTQVKANTDALTKPNHNIKYYSVTAGPSLGYDQYTNENNDGAKGTASLAAGNVTHTDGVASTVVGSYSAVFGTGLQGAAAVSYGTVNVNNNTDTTKAYSGVANSIVGQANMTTNSNAAIIYGAGNTVTDSYRDIDKDKAEAILNSTGNAEQLKNALQDAVPTSGAQVMVMGGGNSVDKAYMTQVTGVGNKVNGKDSTYAEGTSTQYNFVDGFQNELTNGKHDYIIGSKNKVSGDSVDTNQSNIIFGDNHKLTNQQNNVIIGSSDTADDETTASNIVAIGHNAKVSAEGGVAIGSGSVASTAAGAVGYDPTGATAGSTSAWTSKKAAVSIGTAAETRQINGLAAGTEDTDAVNVAQLKKLEGMKANVNATNIGKNLKGADGKTAASDPEKTANEKAWGTAIGTGEIAEGNGQLVTGGKVYDALHGGLTDITIGKPGTAGKDGEDGSIGLVGPKGENGKDGKTTTIIKTETGAAGVNGKDGKDGITRIVYNDTEDPANKHTVATLDDGMKFGDDFGSTAAVKLDHQLDIVGDINAGKTDGDTKATVADLSDGNIGVVATDTTYNGDGTVNTNGKLTIKLAKDLKGLHSSTYTTTETTGEGDPQKTTTYTTVINDKGLTITDGPSITKDGIDGGNKVFKNVGAGKVEADSQDAVTGGQLYAEQKARTDADTKLTGDLATETQARTAADTAINNKIGTLNADGHYIQKDASVSSNLNTLDTQVKTNADAISQETQDREAAITNVTNNLNSLSDSAVQYDTGTNKGKVTLAGADGTTITNLKAGEVAETSKDAVNGSQLYAEQKARTDADNKLTGDLATETQARTAADTAINNKIGTLNADGHYIQKDASVSSNLNTLDTHVKTNADAISKETQDREAAITNVTNNLNSLSDSAVQYDADTNKGKVTLAGTDGTTITNLKAGEVAETSKDAVNGSQLYAEQKARTDADNKLTGDLATETQARTAADTAINNKIGTLNADGHYIQKDASVSSNLNTLDTQVKTNADAISKETQDREAAITNITNNIGDLSDSAVKYDADTNKGKVTLAGADGTTITNLKAGEVAETSKDAVNGSQLYAEQKARMDADNKLTSDLAAETQARTAADTAIDNKIGSLDANGNYIQKDVSISSNLSTLDTQVKTNADNIAKNTKSIQNITNNMQNLSENAVKYDGSDKSKVTLGGKDGTVIKNVKDGDLSGSSKDAVNGKQLYNEQQAREAADKAITEKVTNNTNEITKIKNGDFTDASKTAIHNIAKDAVAVVNGKNTTVTKVGGTDTTPTTYAVNVEGTGKVAAGDTGLISGDTLYKEVHIDKDGAYIKGSQSVGQNLSELDTGLKTTSDLIHANEKGDAIQIGGNSTATKVDISGKDSNGNTTGRVITGVVSDVSDPNSAANVGYVNGITSASNEQIYHDMNMQYNHVENDISRAAAGSNALAALHPMQEFDPDDKAQFALGYGHYRNSNAGAVGAFYQPDENSMVNFGVSFGNGDAGINAGVTFKFGPGGSGHHALTKTQMAKVIDAQSKEIDELKKDNADKDKRIDALEQKMTEILAKLDKSKD